MLREEEMERPPLPAWPSHALDYEPAHGLFKRIALANGQFSVRTLAARVGVNGRHQNPQELLEFCRRFPIRNLEALDDNTPRLHGRLVEILGQKLSRRHWSLSSVRACPGCLAESRHHRVWFDLTILRHCPIHDEALVDGVRGEKLASWYPGIGVTPGGAVVCRGERLVQAGHRRSLESYVLGRMGVVAGFSVSSLDDYELYEVVEAADLLGGMSALASGAVRSQAARSVSVRADDIAAGFEILAGGETAIEEAMRRSLGFSERIAVPNLTGPRVRRWLHQRLAELSSDRLATAIRGVQGRVSREHGLIPRRPEIRSATDPLTLSDAAKSLGLELGATRRLAIRLGFIDGHIRPGRVHQIQPAHLTRMRETIAAIVPRARACELVGVDGQTFVELCRRMKVEPIIRLGGLSVAFDRFDPFDLEELAPAAKQATSTAQDDNVSAEVVRRREARIARRLAIRTRHTGSRATLRVRAQSSDVERPREVGLPTV